MKVLCIRLSSAVLLCLLASCGSDSVQTQPAEELLLTAPAGGQTESGALPALPVDVVQEWEELDGSGNVIPYVSDHNAKGVAATSPDSEFVPGAERFMASEHVSNLGEGSSLDSGLAGENGLEWAIYRLTLSGDQPGLVMADINLDRRSDNQLSNYWIGLSDYSTNRWEIHGPFKDNHLRVGTAQAVREGKNYTSEFGNLFVAIIGYDGSRFDIVAISADRFSNSDDVSPPAPLGLVVTPQNGSLYLQWHNSPAGDLAGYNIYHSTSWFYDRHGMGARHIGYIEGRNSALVDLPVADHFIRVTAMDIHGNESPPSDVVVASPLTGLRPPLLVKVDEPSALYGDDLYVRVSGGTSYDFDLDGNGVYEITGSTAAQMPLDTSTFGIVRPVVRAYYFEDTAVAHGGVSVILTFNSRPAAAVLAIPSVGDSPFEIQYTGTGQDLEDSPEELSYAWDFLGTGEWSTVWTIPVPPPLTAASADGPLVFNTILRVTDTDGAWATATIAIWVRTPLYHPPETDVFADPTSGQAPLFVQFFSTGTHDVDGDETITKYEYDLNGDGYFEIWSAAPLPTSFTYDEPGEYVVTLRATDEDGFWDEDTETITVTAP
jgi:hypothetical protein